MRTTYDLSPWGLVKISGNQAKQLLQGQLTCNLDRITSTQTSLAALCNPQGRIISLFYVFFLQDAYYFLLARSMVAITIAALNKYAKFYRVELSEASDALSLIACVAEQRPVNHPDYCIITIPHDAKRYIIAGNLSSLPWAHTQKKSSEDWHLLDIMQTIPAIYPETSGKFLPHELRLPALDAIDFDKGCYTGQEIIARMHYRGKTKNHLCEINISADSAPLLGSDLAAGTLVDVCHIKDNNYATLILANILKTD